MVLGVGGDLVEDTSEEDVVGRGERVLQRELATWRQYYL